MSWIISLVNHDKVELGMHSSITLKNSCFQDSQLDSMSEGSIMLLRSRSISRSLALSKSACLYYHTFLRVEWLNVVRW